MEKLGAATTEAVLDQARAQAASLEQQLTAARHSSTAASRQARAAGMDIGPDDRGLFEALKAWRRREAQSQALPRYVIFHDRTLAEIAAARPRTLDRLAECNGVGQGKLERYGAAVLAVVREAAEAA
jgi:ATP-dependent DNA helicase RecQ